MFTGRFLRYFLSQLTVGHGEGSVSVLGRDLILVVESDPMVAAWMLRFITRPWLFDWSEMRDDENLKFTITTENI